MDHVIAGSQLRKRRGLRAPTFDAAEVKAPRFPTRSLSDQELHAELERAEPGPWRDAVRAELERRST